jgi:hypothetical protein
LALVLDVGAHRELLPVYNHSLLVDAAVTALRNVVDDARRETDPAAADMKAEEALVLSRVFGRLVPEIRELLASRTSAPMTRVLVQ